MAGHHRPHPLTDFEQLLREASTTPIEGWDFTSWGDRLRIGALPWDFAATVSERAAGAASLLDIDTGGGEWLAALPRRPARTVATESWPGNVPVARKRLEPLGIELVEAAGAPDNVVQRDDLPTLPFENGSFEVVCCRHASYVPAEVARVLAPGGTFLTQQVGGDYRAFDELLGIEPRPAPDPVWDLRFAEKQLAAVGLTVSDGAEGAEEIVFADAGVLAWYLRRVPWAVDGFTIDGFREPLRRLRTPARVRQPAFWLEARRP